MKIEKILYFGKICITFLSAVERNWRGKIGDRSQFSKISYFKQLFWIELETTVPTMIKTPTLLAQTLPNRGGGTAKFGQIEVPHKCWGEDHTGHSSIVIHQCDWPPLAVERIVLLSGYCTSSSIPYTKTGKTQNENERHRLSLDLFHHSIQPLNLFFLLRDCKGLSFELFRSLLGFELLELERIFEPTDLICI